MKLTVKETIEIQKKGFSKEVDKEWILNQCYFQIRQDASLGLGSTEIPKHCGLTNELITEVIKDLQEDGFTVKDFETDILISWE